MSAYAGGRTFEEQVRYIIQGVAGGGTALTDFNPLSVIRTICEAMAIVGERISEEMLARVAEAIDRAAYRSFGFPRLLARRATTTLVISRADTAFLQVVPAGTFVRVPGTTRQYATAVELRLPAGTASATVPALAAYPGAFYNTAALTVAEFVSTVPGAALQVSNPVAVTNGDDDETDEARRVRFNDYITGIHRSTAAAIEHGARTAVLTDEVGNELERVRGAQVHDAYGVARCWVWDGQAPLAPSDPVVAAFDLAGAGASTALVAEAQRVVNGYYDARLGRHVTGYKAAGVIVNLRPATLRVQPVNAVVYLAPGYTMNMVSETIVANLLNAFGRLTVGATALRLNDLRQAVGFTRGVIDHQFLNPTADVPGGDGIAIVPGSFGVMLG